jgi:7-cyano-7-deazaguanine synthase
LPPGASIPRSASLSRRRSDANVLALGVDYGQRNRIELDRLDQISARMEIEALRVSIDMGKWLRGGLIGQEDPGDLAASNYVPGRNVIFLSVAASVAEARGAGRIYVGATASDHHHPDCRPAFFAAYQEALRQGQDAAPEVRAPLVGLSKAQVVRAALSLGVPLELTWSCHLPGPEPCMGCGPCRLRRETFAEIGMDDPGAPA